MARANIQMDSCVYALTWRRGTWISIHGRQTGYLTDGVAIIVCATRTVRLPLIFVLPFLRVWLLFRDNMVCLNFYNTICFSYSKLRSFDFVK